MGLDDRNIEVLWKELSQWDKIAEADISGWDWCVQPWMMDFEVAARYMLAGKQCDEWYRAMKNRVYCETLSVFLLSDGRLYVQKKRGKRCSGSYATSSGNSRMRWAVGKLIGADKIVTNGDDSCETPVERAVELYTDLGLAVKTYEVSRDGSFEFCSTKFEKGVGYPIHWDRTFFRLLHNRYEKQLYDSFLKELRHSPYLRPCVRVLEEIEWFPPGVECSPAVAV